MRQTTALITFAVMAICCSRASSGPTAGKDAIAPEVASGYLAKPPSHARQFMVSAAHPLAVDAGLDALKSGGNALDAAIVVVLALNVVEPQSSGIGGGGFMLFYDASYDAVSESTEGGATSRLERYDDVDASLGLHVFDGRELAPQGARPEQFLDANGEERDFYDALVGGHAVGVPGVIAMMKMAHDKHGKLPWARLFDAAIKLAEDGFPISERLHRQIAATPNLKLFAPTRALFFGPDGETPLPAGAILKNPELTATFRKIATAGIEPFYAGDIAADMVQAIITAGKNPGAMTLADLQAYRAIERRPLCAVYREYRVCSAPPPTSGGVAVLQILGILENFDVRASGPLSAGFIHLFTQASRLAYADRDLYLGDPAFVRAPISGLLDKSYLKSRAALISMDRDMGEAEPGKFAGYSRSVAGRAQEFPSTTHISVVDGEGNAVSFTNSIENGFGSTLMARGFLLNNTLTDFSFKPEVNGKPVANRIEPGKRPRSSMAPVMVFDARTGALKFVVGSPGGPNIIEYVAQTLIAVLDHGLDAEAAVGLPHAANRNGETELESGAGGDLLATKLSRLGHAIKITELTSGLQAIQLGADGLIGGADPRRDGVAGGL